MQANISDLLHDINGIFCVDVDKVSIQLIEATLNYMSDVYYIVCTLPTQPLGMVCDIFPSYFTINNSSYELQYLLSTFNNYE